MVEPGRGSASGAAAFEAMYREWRPTVVEGAFAVLGDRDAAQGVAQDVFRRLWASGGWRAIEQPASYFARAARREAIRRRSRERRLAEFCECVEPRPDALTLVLKAERQAALVEGMRSLPPKCRRVMNLSICLGFTHREIAERMGVTKKGVERQITIGRRKLGVSARRRSVARGGGVLMLGFFTQVVACEPSADSTEVARADSAGVWIVAFGSLDSSRTSRWAVDATPELVIGDHDEVGQPVLHTVTSGSFLRDGGVLVGDAGASQVLSFDRSGGVVGSAGREGEGPGEFRWITSLKPLDDGRVLVYDQRLGRVTILDGSLGVSETRTVVAPSGMPATDVLSMEEGSVVAVEAGPTAGYGEEVAEGLVTSPAVYLRLWNEGGVDTITTAPGDELFLLRARSGGFGGFMIPLFGMQHAAAAVGERLFVRTGRGPEVAVHDLTKSRMVGLVRWVAEDRVVRDADIEAALRGIFPDDPTAARRFDVPVPQTKSAFGRLLTDTQGNLWLSEYAQYLQDPERWWIIDINEGTVATVTLPPQSALLDIREDRLLVRRKDALERETLQILRLERGG